VYFHSKIFSDVLKTSSFVQMSKSASLVAASGLVKGAGIKTSDLVATLSITPSSSGSTTEFTLSEDIVIIAEFENKSKTETYFFLRWGSPLGSTPTNHKFNINGPSPMLSTSISRTPITADELEILHPGASLRAETKFDKFRQVGAYKITATPISVYPQKNLQSGVQIVQFIPDAVSFKIK
jgi:hypothetical protein